MFERVAIGVADLQRSRRFYAAVLAQLGIGVTTESATEVVFGDFAIAAASTQRRVTTGLHVGFAAASREHCRRFWRAGVEAGFRDDGEPGPRPEYGSDYFGAFLLDPDGNSAEAVVHDNQRATGGVDHLWIRVIDHAEAREDALRQGVPVVADEPGLTRFSPGPKRGSFTVLAGAPTTTAFSMVLRDGPPPSG